MIALIKIQISSSVLKKPTLKFLVAEKESLIFPYQLQ